MNGILPTADSELRLRTTFRIWDANTLPNCDCTEEIDLHTELVSCDMLLKMKPEDMKLFTTWWLHYIGHARRKG